MKEFMLKDYIKSCYIPYIECIRKKEAFQKDIGVLSIICNYSISRKKLTEINLNDLNLFFGQLKKDRKVSYATLNRYRARLHAIFSHAVNEDIINYNPVTKVRRYKETARNRCLSPIEVQGLLYYAKESSNKELYLVIMFALNTGMRLSEILNLKVSDINNNIITLSENTKSKAKRVIVLNNNLLSVIKEHIFLMDYKDYIFSVKSVKRSFSTALSRAGIKDFRFHDLRRTFATYLLETGASLKVVQSILGHSSIRMTEVYLSSNLEKTVDAVEKLCFT